MNIEQLRYFSEVAQRGSFAKAADALYITRNGLTYQIKQLERELGFDLFERDSRHVALTQKGSELLPVANDMLARWDGAMASIEASEGNAGAIRVGMAYFMDKRATDAVDVAFKEKCPGCWVEPIYIQPYDTVEYIDHLFENKLDALYMTDREIGEINSVSFITLGTTNYGCLVTPTHRLASFDEVPSSSLDADTLMLIGGSKGPENRPLMKDALRYFDERCPNVRIRTEPDVRSAAYAVEHDGCVGIIPYVSDDELAGTGLVVRPLAELSNKFGIATASRSGSMKPMVRAYLDACVEVYGQR